jgi:hypothetical protein
MTHPSSCAHTCFDFRVSSVRRLVRLAIVLAHAVLIVTCQAEETHRQKTNSGKPEVIRFVDLDANEIMCTIGSDGAFADHRKTGAGGLVWPKEVPDDVVFSAGLWVVGRHVPSGALRTATVDYESEYQPGPLLETFNTTTNDDTGPVSRATDSVYRAYKIQTGDITSKDYLEWPGTLGAPYIDMNGNGVWDPGVDRPKISGDQQVWNVTNDAAKSRHAAIGMTAPMGLEVHSLYYAYNRPGALANAMFIEWTLINKSDADYDSVYMGLWSDPDVYYPSDDLPGSDSALGLGYVYNETDTTYYGIRQPAIGFVLLGGPLLPGSPTDSAIVDGKWIRGFKNHPLSASIAMSKSTNLVDIKEPKMSDSSFANVVYAYLHGMAGRGGYAIRRRDSSYYPTFWFSGDPVTGQGDLPGNFPLGTFIGQDLRLLLSSGPFVLAKGDTQHVAAAFVISRGSSQLDNVARLKSDVTFVRDFYYNGQVTDVHEYKAAALPASCALEQNYPNPFNPGTSIGYTVGAVSSQQTAVSSHVRLVVYDLLGRQVAVLVDERKEPGAYIATWNATNTACGVYIYRLTASNSTLCKTMVLLK